MTHKHVDRGEQRRVGHIGMCETHSKLLYTGRQEARNAISAIAGKGMRAYKCTAADGMWHIGHMPKDVRNGRISAKEIYG